MIRKMENSKVRLGFVTGSSRGSNPNYCPKRVTAVEKGDQVPPPATGSTRILKGQLGFLSELCHGDSDLGFPGEYSGYTRREQNGKVKVRD